MPPTHARRMLIGACYPMACGHNTSSGSWHFGDAADFVRGLSTEYAGLLGTVVHQRGTLYVKASAAGLPPYIVVVDRVATDRARTVQVPTRVLLY